MFRKGRKMANLELYKIFVMVAKEENLTKASEKLYISQPAVTKHIKNLEEMLEIKLFCRSNHGILLTQQGKKLYEEIKEPIHRLLEVDEKYVNKNRNINLGVHSTILNKILGECINYYYKENIKSKINTFNLENQEMIRKLKEKELDIVFSKKLVIEDKKQKIEFIKLGKWTEILIANGNSKWKGKIVTVEDLKHENFYMPRKRSATPKNFFESTNSKYEDFNQIEHITYGIIVDVLKNTEGIGLVTKEFVEKELEKNKMIILKTEFEIAPVEYGIYLNKDNKFEELDQFIEIIRSTLENRYNI